MIKCVTLFFLLFAVSFGRLYENKEQVAISVNTVRPFNNPAEAYAFYSLPFCKPKDYKEAGKESFGDALAGDRREQSAYEILFKVPVIWQRLCQFQLSQDEIKKFRDAIEEDYMFEMFIDELPVVGFIGDAEEVVETFADHKHNSTKYYLYTHLAFSIAYNPKGDGGHIIAVNITTNRAQRVELKMGEKINVDYSFSCKWTPVDVPYSNRLQLHQKLLIGDQSLEIHWLSIINSFVLVILLTSFLAIILMRVLKNDFSRYMDSDAEELGAEIVDDSGWKQVHGDVFRFPDRVMLLSACVGNGLQILFLFAGMVMLAVIGLVYSGGSGSLYAASVLLYALSSGFSGYFSSYFYHQLGGTHWSTNAVLTFALFNVPLVTVFAVLNSIAISYGSTSALPVKALLSVIALLLFITLPLTIFGAHKARKGFSPFQSPCKTNFAKREIPKSPWYRRLPFQMSMAGFLPFSAIYIELHYTFSAVWGHRVYTLFGLLGLAFLMLVIVTSFITIALTYFQLAAEDWRWWWRSFLFGGSAGGFIFGYAVFFFKYRSNMTGFLQSAFFFGYVLILAYAFFLMLGTVGFLSSLVFVRKIYSTIKSD